MFNAQTETVRGMAKRGGSVGHAVVDEISSEQLVIPARGWTHTAGCMVVHGMIRNVIHWGNPRIIGE